MMEIRPNVGNEEDPLKKRIRTRLPNEMRQLIKNVLSQFKWNEKDTLDLTRYIIDSDVDQALEDSIPMKAFFGMLGNKYEQREEAIDHLMKTMIEKGTGGKEKVTQQKGILKDTGKYKELLKKKLFYTRLKRDCRTLEKTMEMRKDLAQTRSANYRTGIKGPY